MLSTNRHQLPIKLEPITQNFDSLGLYWWRSVLKRWFCFFNSGFSIIPPFGFPSFRLKICTSFISCFWSTTTLPGLEKYKVECDTVYANKKKNLSYWLKKQKNLPQKQIILSQPGSEIFSGFLFLDINLFLCLDFRIFTNMASFSLFNFKYALLAQVIKLFIIRNICFLCFYPYYRYLIMLRGQTSFWLM